jgi:hypothetical protein
MPETGKQATTDAVSTLGAQYPFLFSKFALFDTPLPVHLDEPKEVVCFQCLIEPALFRGLLQLP